MQQLYKYTMNMITHTVYRLRKEEFYKYRDHLKALDQPNRYLRFGYNIKDEAIDHLYEKWFNNHNSNIIFAIENSNLEIIGIGHISLHQQQAELAFSVLAQYQGYGIGSALISRVIKYCQNREIKQATMVCIHSNVKIRRLAQKNGVVLEVKDSDVYGKVSVPDPNFFSLWSENLDECLDSFWRLIRIQFEIIKNSKKSVSCA